ncbi:MAG: MFS transporter [Halieaceae bacterium]|nr:MFS transporter [Halieaceae bacterium]
MSTATLPTRHLALLIASLMAISMGQSMTFAILAPLGREVGMTELSITLLIACSSLTFGLASPYWGRMSDRIGRKPLIMVGLVGYFFGTTAFTSAFFLGLNGVLTGTGLFTALLIARCLHAGIMSATGPSTAAYAADNTTPDKRTKAMAKLGTASSLGMILGPAFAGATASFGLMAPLYAAAVLTLIMAALVWKMIPNVPPNEPLSRKHSVKLRYSDPRIWPFIAIATGMFMGFAGVQQTLGFFLQDQFNLSGVRTAQLTGIAMLTSASFTFLIQTTVMQWVNWTPGRFIKIGLSCISMGAVIIASSSMFPYIAFGMGIMGMGVGCTMPSIIAATSLAVAPHEQGAAAGMISGSPAIGFGIGPVFAGYLYQLNPHYPHIAAAIFIALLLVVVVSSKKV